MLSASPLRLPEAVLRATFAEHRRCGGGLAECQVLWIGPWSDPRVITECVHPAHVADRFGFRLDGQWLHEFWLQLAETKCGVRAQVHTHPAEAFHSPTDDAWPIVHTAGFLSLVIPDFAMGTVGFEGAYLAELSEEGHWRPAPIADRIEVVT